MAEGPRQPHLPLPALPQPRSAAVAGSQLPRPTAAGDSPCITGIPRGAVRRALQPLYAGREGIKWPHSTNWALLLVHRLCCLSPTRSAGAPGHPAPSRASLRPQRSEGSEGSPWHRSTFLVLHLMGLSEHFYLLMYWRRSHAVQMLFLGSGLGSSRSAFASSLPGPAEDLKVALEGCLSVLDVEEAD